MNERLLRDAQAIRAALAGSDELAELEKLFAWLNQLAAGASPRRQQLIHEWLAERRVTLTKLKHGEWVLVALYGRAYWRFHHALSLDEIARRCGAPKASVDRWLKDVREVCVQAGQTDWPPETLRRGPRSPNVPSEASSPVIASPRPVAGSDVSPIPAPPRGASGPAVLPSTARAIAAHEALSDSLSRAKDRIRDAVLKGHDPAEVQAEALELERRHRLGPQLAPGDVLDGRFEIVEHLGAGSFGDVWKGYDRDLALPVAVKVLRQATFSSSQRRERFRAGAIRMARSKVPGVVTILQEPRQDASSGLDYVVMELMAGGDLKQAVLRGTLAPEAALRCIGQVIDAVAELHRRGLVHRDIKPTNILLTEHGDARLADFDMVWAPDASFGTQLGQMVGFDYAPELTHEEEAKNVRPSADIYMLALTAVFALGGRVPPVEMKADPRAYIQNLPCSRPWRELLIRSLSWKPAARPADGAAFKAALAALEAEERQQIAEAERERERVERERAEREHLEQMLKLRRAAEREQKDAATLALPPSAGSGHTMVNQDQIKMEVLGALESIRARRALGPDDYVRLARNPLAAYRRMAWENAGGDRRVLLALFDGENLDTAEALALTQQAWRFVLDTSPAESELIQLIDLLDRPVRENTWKGEDGAGEAGAAYHSVFGTWSDFGPSDFGDELDQLGEILKKERAAEEEVASLRTSLIQRIKFDILELPAVSDRLLARLGRGRENLVVTRAIQTLLGRSLRGGGSEGAMRPEGAAPAPAAAPSTLEIGATQRAIVRRMTIPSRRALERVSNELATTMRDRLGRHRRQLDQLQGRLRKSERALRRLSAPYRLALPYSDAQRLEDLEVRSWIDEHLSSPDAVPFPDRDSIYKARLDTLLASWDVAESRRETLALVLRSGSLQSKLAQAVIANRIEAARAATPKSFEEHPPAEETAAAWETWRRRQAAWLLAETSRINDVRAWILAYAVIFADLSGVKPDPVLSEARVLGVAGEVDRIRRTRLGPPPRRLIRTDVRLSTWKWEGNDTYDVFGIFEDGAEVLIEGAVPAFAAAETASRVGAGGRIPRQAGQPTDPLR